jgi:hypothetical protein
MNNYIGMNEDGDDHGFANLAVLEGGLITVGLLSAVAVALDQSEESSMVAVEIELASRVIASTLVSGRSKRAGAGTAEGEPRKRRIIPWDRRRAVMCITEDYFDPQPKFGLDDFKRMFRISRNIYDRLHSYLAGNVTFFRDGFDATGKAKISSHAKILIALKYLCYGCSVNAFRDYFQLGESTAMKSVKLLTKELVQSPFRNEFFGAMTPSDAKQVEALHRSVHGVPGMIGSLDCSHISWGNCPISHQGQFKGKAGEPTIVVEAMVDYNLYAWHAIFGYAGTLNDLSIWDNSFLLSAMCDGSFHELDFQFTIGGETFDELWILVDGIYPPISRFVKPLSVPINTVEALFSLWQESSRKDVERFFGVFKKKFIYSQNQLVWHSSKT